MLQQAGMPGIQDLATDFNQGFEVTGLIKNPCPTWLPRADKRYEFLVSQEAFMRHNKHYTLSKLTNGRVDRWT